MRPWEKETLAVYISDGLISQTDNQTNMQEQKYKMADTKLVKEGTSLEER